MLTIWYCMTMLLIVFTYPFISKPRRRAWLVICTILGLLFALTKEGPELVLWTSHHPSEKRRFSLYEPEPH